MNPVTEITSDTFESEVLNSPVPVLVDLYATWCGPCKMLSPILDRLASQFAGRAKFVKINTDEQPELAAAFGVSSIPMLAVVRDRNVVDTSVGLRSPAEITRMIERALPVPTHM